jgi:hypothetical protein
MKKIAVAAVLLAALFGSGEAARAGEVTHPCLPTGCHTCVDQNTPVYDVHYCVF